MGTVPSLAKVPHALRVRQLLGAIALVAIPTVLLLTRGSDEAPVAAVNAAVEPPGAAAEPLRPRPRQIDRPDGPNVVVIYTDDQEKASFKRAFMPRAFRYLVDRGTRFDQAVAATPVCCPSRVSYLTGQYPHNNGVFSNEDAYPALISPENTLAAWMDDAGYETAWFGKFLQHYQDSSDPTSPAPGWDEWAITLNEMYFDYVLYEKGVETNMGSRPRDYHTNVMTRKAVEFIRRSKASRRPMFLTVNYLAPHKGGPTPGRCRHAATPAPRDLGSAAGLDLPMPPSFDEEDITDKRAYIGEDRIVGRRLEKLQDQIQCRAESLRAADRGIGRIFHAIRSANQLDDTIIVLTSDNGLLLGEHRLEGKGEPYEEALQVPFVIRVPSGLLSRASVPRTDALVANIDIAPTLLDLVGINPCLDSGQCRTMDGRSLVPLIEDRLGDYPNDRGILIEGGFRGGSSCDFRGIRTPDSVLIQRAKGDPQQIGCLPASEPEVYDLDEDPYQLDNLAVTDPTGSEALLGEMLSRVTALERCSGIKGRDAPNVQPFCD